LINCEKSMCVGCQLNVRQETKERDLRMEVNQEALNAVRKEISSKSQDRTTKAASGKLSQEWELYQQTVSIHLFFPLYFLPPSSFLSVIEIVYSLNFHHLQISIKIWNDFRFIEKKPVEHIK